MLEKKDKPLNNLPGIIILSHKNLLFHQIQFHPIQFHDNIKKLGHLIQPLNQLLINLSRLLNIPITLLPFQLSKIFLPLIKLIQLDFHQMIGMRLVGLYLNGIENLIRVSMLLVLMRMSSKNQNNSKEFIKLVSLFFASIASCF